MTDETAVRVTLGLIDWVVIFSYFLSIAGIGLYFSRTQKTTEIYFLASRNVPGWVVGFALLGTMIGSATFIGQPGNVFQTDFWPLPAMLVLPLVMLVIARSLVVFYRRTIRMTAYGYLEKRFGYPARAYGGAAFIVSRIVDVSATFYFLAVAVAFMTGWDIWWVILILGLFTLGYTLTGGIEAVVWVSVLQTLMLLGGGLLILAVVLFKPEASPGQLLSTAWNGGKFNLGDWDFDWFKNNQWLYVTGGFIWAIQRYACDQHLVQKYLIARSDKEAVKSAYIGSTVCIPIWLMFMIIGALVWSFYELGEGALPAEVRAVTDNVMPHFMATQLPVGLVGLMLSALAAAAMSSLAADLNSLGTVITEDFYGRLKRGSTDRQQLIVGKISILVFGLASIVLAQQWIGIQSFVVTSATLLSIVTGGMLGLFMLGLFSRRVTDRGAYAGILACILFTVWGTLTTDKIPYMEQSMIDLGRFNYPLIPFTIGIFNHIAVIGVGLLGSLVLGGPKRDTTGLTIWDSSRNKQKDH
jgi:SSS family solute:Na+ symporter